MRSALVGRAHADGAGAGGLYQRLALHVGAGKVVWRVAEVEAGRPFAVHLAHANLAYALLAQRKRLFDFGDQHNLGRAAREGYRRGGEGAEHVDDDDGSSRLTRVPEKAAHLDFHVENLPSGDSLGASAPM